MPGRWIVAGAKPDRDEQNSKNKNTTQFDAGMANTFGVFRKEEKKPKPTKKSTSTEQEKRSSPVYLPEEEVSDEEEIEPQVTAHKKKREKTKKPISAPPVTSAPPKKTISDILMSSADAINAELQDCEDNVAINSDMVLIQYYFAIVGKFFSSSDAGVGNQEDKRKRLLILESLTPAASKIVQKVFFPRFRKFSSIGDIVGAMAIVFGARGSRQESAVELGLRLCIEVLIQLHVDTILKHITSVLVFFTVQERGETIFSSMAAVENFWLVISILIAKSTLASIEAKKGTSQEDYACSLRNAICDLSLGSCPFQLSELTFALNKFAPQSELRKGHSILREDNFQLLMDLAARDEQAEEAKEILVECGYSWNPTEFSSAYFGKALSLVQHQNKEIRQLATDVCISMLQNEGMGFRKWGEISAGNVEASEMMLKMAMREGIELPNVFVAQIHKKLKKFPHGSSQHQFLLKVNSAVNQQKSAVSKDQEASTFETFFCVCFVAFVVGGTFWLNTKKGVSLFCF